MKPTSLNRNPMMSETATVKSTEASSKPKKGTKTVEDAPAPGEEAAP